MFKRFVPAWLIDTIREIRGFKRWEGGEVPVSGPADIILREGGSFTSYSAMFLDWEQHGEPSDIVWYRPHNLG